MTSTRVRRTKTRTRPAAVAQPVNIFGMPADRDTIFCDHRGIQKARIEKRQRKLIAKSAFIKFFLHAGERLRCLTTAYAPVDRLEKLLIGPAFLFFRRSLLIFTDQRILHTPTRFNRSPRGSVSQITYADMAALNLKGRTLTVHYKNGRQERFPYIGRAERKKLQTLLDEVQLTPKAPNHLGGRTHLCPSCTEPLKTAARTCSACRLRFKTGTQALWHALLIPGGGYFFSRHPATGVMVGVTEVVLGVLTAFVWSAFSRELPVSNAMLLLPPSGLLFIKSIAAFHARRLIGEGTPANRDYVQRKL